MSAETPRNEPSYEAAREELVDVVRRLEAGGIGLEESLALWERGEQLAALCERYLEGARARVDAALSAGGQTTPREGAAGQVAPERADS